VALTSEEEKKNCCVNCFVNYGGNYCFCLQGTNLDGVIAQNISSPPVEIANSAIVYPEDAGNQFLRNVVFSTFSRT
jgi:hypothetical protein